MTSLLLLLIAPPGPLAGADLIPPEKRWAAVAGCVRVSSGGDAGVVGAAACVGYKDGFAYLLTANHAVPKTEGRKFEFYTQESYPEAAQSAVGGEVVVRLPDADVALVKIKVEDRPAMLPLAGPGERPKHFPFAAVSVGCPAGEVPLTRAEKVVAKRAARRPEGGIAFFWELADRPIGGMSGGPLLDAKGRVIGVCSAAKPDGAGYFAHLDEVLAGLKHDGYGWLIAQAGR
ncbi:MAG TPA: serine protease [Fimbriiglobus sp.]|nr:serine protease [Fimbriiglobus sp.]